MNQEAETLLADSKAEIAALVVDQSCRGQGIGAALVKKAETWAKERNLSLLMVRSNVKREAAHRFYQREGYSLNKTGHVFVKNI